MKGNGRLKDGARCKTNEGILIMETNQEGLDRDPFEQLSRQETGNPLLTEEDRQIIRMAEDNIRQAFETVFGGNNDTAR